MSRSGANIFAIDTAASIFSVALGTAEGLWYAEVDAGTRHSQLLMETADFLLKQAGIKPPDLSLVACMKGPGSFTGLRIGFSAAKGMALALDIPFTAISSLDCMAYPFSEYPALVLPLIDAKKKSWYCALYAEGKRLTADMDADAQAIAASIDACFAEGSEKKKNHGGHGEGGGYWHENPHKQVFLTGPDADSFYREFNGGNKGVSFTLDPGHRKGCARELLAIAQKRNIGDNVLENINSGPDYIRKSDAEINSEK